MTSPSTLPSTSRAPSSPPRSAPASLTARQERFCQKYVIDPNATRAAVHAGYSARSAGQQGHRLLADPRIAARIRALQAAVAERACADTDVLLCKLEHVYARALENHHFHAAGKAVEIQARLRAARAGAEMMKNDEE
jgi:phage terminase small subunit